MPNWCYSVITINHTDKSKLQEFYEKLEKWLKTPYAENGFDQYSMGWLGNIVGNSGISKHVKKGDTEEFEPYIRCRGSVEDMKFEDGQITINTETAWSPCLKMFSKVCDKYLPDAEILFEAEEPGVELYISNDPCVVGTYTIDVYDEPPEHCKDLTSDYYLSEKGVRDILQKAFQTDEEDINKLIDIARESEWINVHQYDECSIEDCE
jgi:hypothetical protein